MDKGQILEILSQVQHAAYESDVVSLGMMDNLHVSEDGPVIRFALVFPRRDPLAASIKFNCREALEDFFGEGTEVVITEVINEKKPAKKSSVDELGFDELGNVGKIIAVASGKGGVGKSTVAVNLAVTLARKGYKVGLADADVYGPSIPKMTGTEGAIIDGIGEKGEIMVPVEKYGVKWISIGYLTDPDQALIWRGPMACNALKQMILQVRWGKLDYLLLDMPPGTGDIHISLLQDIPLDGAVIVSTPQAVALSDVERGINMFRHPQIAKPVLGIIENMSWFTPAELPQNKYYIFGKEGCRPIAEKYGIPLLAQIPLVQSIREGGDDGEPAALNDGPVFDALKKINL